MYIIYMHACIRIYIYIYIYIYNYIYIYLILYIYIYTYHSVVHRIGGNSPFKWSFPLRKSREKMWDRSQSPGSHELQTAQVVWTHLHGQLQTGGETMGLRGYQQPLCSFNHAWMVKQLIFHGMYAFIVI